MYRNRNRSRFQSNARNYSSRNNHNSGRNRQVDTLDISQFVKKAVNIPASETIQSNATFTDFKFIEILNQNIISHGYKIPSPIQEKSIPHILAGRDVIGIANTGTGKTAAFLLPLLEKIYNNNNEYCLIITPTRELAMQIQDELYAFAKGMRIMSVLCIGGANIQRQEQQLRRDPQFVIGTPGRLKDLIGRKSIRMNIFNNVVLDEVDRMVDIGFIHDIRTIISFLPSQRQSLFYSATVTDKVKNILDEFVHNPVTVSVKKQPTSANVDQDVIRVKDKFEKLEVLQKLLQQEEFKKVLVFGRTKWGVEKINKELIRNGFRSASIHGNKSQGQRQRALEQFKQQQLQVLLATDVASRGLDIENVTHVINFDIPATYDDYIHRIGRTGRADKKGIALTFVE